MKGKRRGGLFLALAFWLLFSGGVLGEEAREGIFEGGFEEAFGEAFEEEPQKALEEDMAWSFEEDLFLEEGEEEYAQALEEGEAPGDGVAINAFGEEAPFQEFTDLEAAFEESEEEPFRVSLQDGWELSLVYFDSQVNGGETAITPNEPLIWHANGTDTQRELTLQIEYANTQVKKSYGPGEVEIVLPDLAYLVSGGRKDSLDMQKIVIAADTQAEGSSEYVFWHEYILNKETGVRQHVFRNKNTLEQDTNFQGSIQIEYGLQACAMDTGGDYTLMASLNESVISNSMRLIFDSTPCSFTVSKEAKRVDSMEGLPSGDYIWAYFQFFASSLEESGIRFLDLSRSYFLETLPADCLVYDHQKNLVQAGADGTFPLPISIQDSDYNRQVLGSFCYVGFPKETYGTYQFVNQVELWGPYNSQDALNGKDGEVEKIASATLSVSVADFEFLYTGDLYSLEKTITSNSVGSIPIQKDYEGVCFQLTGQCTYTSGTMRVTIGDDALGLMYDTGEFHLLGEEDYYFTQVTVPRMRNQAGNLLPTSQVSYTLYYRRQGEKSYASTTLRSRRTVSFSSEDRVVDWYVVIDGVKDDLVISDNCEITACVCVHDENLTPSGELVNFSYLQVHLNEVAQINPGLENYGNDFTRETIAAFDQSRYGEYRYRAAGRAQVRSYHTGYGLELSFGEATSNSTLSRFDLPVTAEADLVRRTKYCVTSAFQGYNIFLLLPAGYELTGDYSLSADPEGVLWNWMRKSDGSSFASREAYQQYLQDHLRVTSRENYRGTGRTMANIQIDLRDDPLDMTGIAKVMKYAQGVALKDVLVQLEGFVSYDNYLDYGNTYTMDGLIMENGIDDFTNQFYPDLNLYLIHEDLGFGPATNLVPGTMDVDEDGCLDELAGHYTVDKYIMDAISTHQDISVLVESERQNFNTSFAETTPAGTYTYKLRVRNAQEQVTDVVLYEPLENAQGEGERFTGILEGFDTSYAKQLGYSVKVYGSSLSSPSALGQVEGEWALMEEGDDLTLIRTLAFEFLNQDGTAAVLPGGTNLYVLVNMRAPLNEAAGKKAFNQCYVTWKTTDSQGNPLSGETSLTSNIVEVRLVEAANPEYSITLEKRILKSEVNFAQGYPTFFLCVTGEDTQGGRVSLEKALQFQPSDEEVEGYLSKSVTFSLKAGTYLASERKGMRYQLSSLLEVTGGSILGQEVSFALSASSPTGRAVFLNEKTREMGLSDTALVINTVG